MPELEDIPLDSPPVLSLIADTLQKNKQALVFLGTKRSAEKTAEDFTNILKALKNYLDSDRVSKEYIQNASTWFNNWRDWIDFKEPVKSVQNGGSNGNPNARFAGHAKPVPGKYHQG